MNTKEIAQVLFETHPTVNTFHITSDGMAFAQDVHAEAHSRSLEDRTIVPEHRNTDAESEYTAESQEDFIAEIKALLATSPTALDKKKKADLESIAAQCGISLEAGATNPQILELIKAL